MSQIFLDARQERIKGRRQKRKQGRQARLRRQIFRYILLAGLLYAGYAGFAYVNWKFAGNGPDIVVRGNQVVSGEQVRQALASFSGYPIYRLDPQKMEAKVRSLPAVHQCFVRRYLFPVPNVQVEIMEEFPWATYAPSPEAAAEAVIAETGKFVPLLQFPSMAQPSLKVYADQNFRLKASDVEQWANWVQYVAAQTGAPVDYVDLRKKGDLRIHSGDYLIRIGQADATLSRRLTRLPSVLPVVATLKSDEQLDYIDLSLESNVPLKVSKVSERALAARQAKEAKETLARESLASQPIVGVAPTEQAPLSNPISSSPTRP